MSPARVLLATFLIGSSAIAAESEADGVALSLEKAETLSLARNHDIRIERESLAGASAEVESASGSYDPTLRFFAGYRDRTDAVNSILSGAPPGELGPEFRGANGTAEVSQRLRTGGEVSVSASLARDQTDSVLVLLTPAYSTALAVDFRQPLLRNRSVDPSRTVPRLARTGEERSRELLEARVSDSLAAVGRAYWDLVAARRDLAVREASVELAVRQQAETQARVDTGDLAESDLAEPQAEIERRRVELLAAREAVLRGENLLKELILAGSSDPWWGVRLVPSDAPVFVARTVSLDTALEEARTSRPEVAAARMALSLEETSTAEARDAVRPELDLVASYALRGLAGSENPNALDVPALGGSTVPPPLAGGLGTSFSRLADGSFPDASIGFALSVPVGNRGAKGDAAVAASRVRRSELLLSREVQRVEVEVRNAVVALETARQRITAAGAGLQAAEAQLRVAEERFAVGSTTNFVVLTRQNDLARARVTETAALTDYRKALIEHDRARGRLLAERGYAIEDEVEP